MYQLYYSPGACSMAIHAVLNELNQKVELKPVSLQNGDTRTPEYLKMNPRGQVPLLLVDGKPMVEGAAMITYLCDTHGPTELLPAKGWERAQALQWLMFANSTLHPAYSRIFGLMRNVKDEAQKAELIGLAINQVQTLWDQIEQELQHKPYLAGSHCTAGDIVTTVIANWGSSFPKPLTFGPKTQAMLKAVSNRLSFRNAMVAEGVEYKAAA
jgi:glutathione S-transferase